MIYNMYPVGHCLWEFFLKQFVFSLTEPEWITTLRPSFVLFFSVWYCLNHTSRINVDHTQMEKTELEFTFLENTLIFFYLKSVWIKLHCLFPVPIVECVLVTLYRRVWLFFQRPCFMLMTSKSLPRTDPQPLSLPKSRN